MLSRISSGGFTLVELMVALALGLFLAGSAILMYSSGRSASADAEVLSRVQENVRFASDFLVRDLRNAGFDDVVELSVEAADEIRSRFLAVEADGARVAVRYAGRGHCGERFTDPAEYRVVQNTYTVANGELQCTGAVWNGTTFQPASPVALVSGLVGVQFETICQSAGTCGTSCAVSDSNPCIGVRARLDFQGLRPLNAGGNAALSVDLTAGMRNSVMEILYQNVIANE